MSVDDRRDVPVHGHRQLRRPLRHPTAHREYAENAYDLRGGLRVFVRQRLLGGEGESEPVRRQEKRK